MTSEAKKSLFAAVGVLSCLFAVGAGAVLRDRVDLGSRANTLDLGTLVASNTESADLPETRFFDDIRQLLKEKYVDPIPDEMKLADGAVRGMVASLSDANSLYMDKDEFRVYSNTRAGKYEGIGAELVLRSDKPNAAVKTGPSDAEEDGADSIRLPKLVIAAIVPGSAAEKAGLKVGDWVESVNDHWVPNSEALDRFASMAEQVKNGKAKPADYLKLRKELRDNFDKHILAIRAREVLMLGSTSDVKTVWVRGTQRIPVTLQKGTWEFPGFGVQANGSIRLPFVNGSNEKLREAIKGKSEVTLDLRNNVRGDFDEMLACLKVVAPNGTYGYFTTEKTERPWPLTISDSNAKPLRLTLMVDLTTRGAAEIFALALSSRGLAKLSGSETAGQPFVIRWNELPDGAGYTLVTSRYQVNAPSSTLAHAGGSR